MTRTRNALLTATLTACFTLFLVYQADAFDCYHCTLSGDSCTDKEEVGDNETFTGSCSGGSKTKSGCSFCTTENKTLPNGKTIIKSRCENKNHNPIPDGCGVGNGKPESCFTTCNWTLCNYDCYSGADQLSKSFLELAILPTLSMMLLIINQHLIH